MAGFVGISTPTIQWDNETISIIPNTFKYKAGVGDRSVTTQSAGGSSVDIVVTEDAETKKSMVTFELKATPQNIALYEEKQQLLAASAITASDAKSGYTKDFSNMTVISDSEISLTQDGNIVVELEGSPAIG